MYFSFICNILYEAMVIYVNVSLLLHICYQFLFMKLFKKIILIITDVKYAK